MKRLLLPLIILTTLPAFAQKFEFGANMGASINSKATNNLAYKGDGIAINYATSFFALMNIRHNLQIGIDANVLQLSRTSPDYYLNGKKVIDGRTDGKQFIYSKVTTAFDAVLNKKFYTRYGYFYGGIGIGVSVARNFNKNTPSPSADYIAPDGGVGPVFGVQAGYTYNFSKRFAFNIEAAVRDFDLDYSAHAPVFKPYSYLHYRVVAYPVTVGIRYCFGFHKAKSAYMGGGINAE